MERMHLATLEPGTIRQGAACLRSREERQTQSGKPYLVIELCNRTGKVSARIWSEALPEWDGVEVGAAVEVEGRVKAGYRGGEPELDVIRVQPLPDDHPVRLEINLACPVPREELETRYRALTRLIDRPEASHLLFQVLEPHREKFWTAPAAKGMHHAHVSGLLLHSIEVAESAVAMSELPMLEGRLDRSMLVVGSLLHDAAKVFEYEWEGVPIDISPEGRLVPHLVRGPEMVAEASSHAVECGLVARADYLHLRHVMLSHHGKEYGSPLSPATAEAMVIHIADLASARLRPMVDALASQTPDADGWVTRNAGWKREPLWIPGAALAADDESRRAKWAEVERKYGRGSKDPWDAEDDPFATEAPTAVTSIIRLPNTEVFDA